MSFLFGEIHQNCAGLENGYGVSTVGGVMVNDGRNAVVRADLQEVRRELIAGVDIDGHDLVLQPELGDQNGDLVPVGRRPRVLGDHIAAAMALPASSVLAVPPMSRVRGPPSERTFSIAPTIAAPASRSPK